jgi:mRNA interferase MazF
LLQTTQCQRLKSLRRLIMPIKQFEIWLADLNPQIGTEPGKTRPVLIVQTNLLNKIPHPSTIVCPLTSNVNPESEILRINMEKGTANLTHPSDIMIDQIRAIDTKRLINKIGQLPDRLTEKVKENLQIILDIE